MIGDGWKQEGCLLHYLLTVFPVQLIDISMAVSHPCMVDAIPVCDSSNKWPRVFGERVEFGTVDAGGEYLTRYSQS